MAAAPDLESGSFIRVEVQVLSYRPVRKHYIVRMECWYSLTAVNRLARQFDSDLYSLSIIERVFRGAL